MWEINGLPLHPLVVHAAVVFGPLAALSALAYVGLPKYRDSCAGSTLVARSARDCFIWAAYLTGNNFFSNGDFDTFAQKIAGPDRHARELRRGRCGGSPPDSPWRPCWRSGCTAVPVSVRVVLGVLVVVGAVVTLIWVVLTGEAGARAVWGS